VVCAQHAKNLGDLLRCHFRDHLGTKPPLKLCRSLLSEITATAPHFSALFMARRTNGITPESLKMTLADPLF
jgi:hypothetical protein